MPSDEAQEARQRAEAARAEAEGSVQAEQELMGESVSVWRRLRDHNRADTFTAMIQRELTRRELGT